VTTADVDDLLCGLELSDNTIRGVATALGALYTMAERRELVGKEDRPSIEPPASWGSNSEHRETPKYLDDDEVARLVEAAPERIEVMLKLGLRTGLRIGELLGLCWDSVDFQTKQIEIKRQWRRDCADAASPADLPPPKYGLVRTIPVTEDTLDLLRAHRKTRWSCDTYVFSFRALPEIQPLAPCGIQGSCLEPIHIQRMRSVTKWTFKRAEIDQEKAGWHCIRHTFAARLATSGMSLRVLQKLLGHCSITTTEIYADLLPQSGDIARAILRENAM
jgi:integrase